MGKMKVSDLAKELKVPSKRVIEKLSEIDINVKSYASYLSEEDIDRFKKYVGVVKHSDDKSEDKAATKSDNNAKTKRTIPIIVRKTEIILNSENEYSNNKQQDNRKKGNRKNYVRVATSDDGLMAGYTRDDKKVSNSKKKTKETAPKSPKVTPKQKVNTVKKEKKDDNFIEIDGMRIKKVKKVVKHSIEKQKDNLQENVVTEVTTNDVVKDEIKDTNNKNISKIENEEKTEKNVKTEDMSVEVKMVAETVEKIETSTSEKAEETKKTIQTSKEVSSKYPKNQQSSVQTNVNNISTKRTNTNYRDNRQRTSQNSSTDAKKPYRPTDNRQNNDRNKERQGFDNNYRRNDGQRVASSNSNNYNRNDRPKTAGNNSNNYNRNDRPKTAGNNSNNFKNRGQFNKDNKNNFGKKPLVIPKSEAQTEEKPHNRGERREFQNKDIEKNVKREIKKTQNKNTANKGQKPKRNNDIAKSYIGQKTSVSEIMSDEYVINNFYNDNSRRRKDRRKGNAKPKHIAQKEVLTEIKVGELITIKSFAERLKKTSTEVIKKLMAMGIMATLNQEIDFETASIISDEFGIKVTKEVIVTEEDILFDEVEDKEEDLVTRAPVVVVMGHVDHGKTSLLDAIREANIADNEAGGITQHIGAHTVQIHGRDITFLDTPGHEAFTSMRARGAMATDIAILVVAADDGVMPQTIEAINHAKAAGVSIIIAINKIDKDNANPDRVKQELTEHDILIEEWGGDVIAVPVSATERTNLDQLLEMVLLSADMLELKANPNRQAKGVVIESQLDKGKGVLASILVQQGTLKKGDFIIAGTSYGRIRVMTDDKGNIFEKAGPSTPVEVSGLSEVPVAGEEFYAVVDEKVAKQLVEKRKDKLKEETNYSGNKVSLEDLFSRISEGDIKELNIIIKADVNGSVEAIKQSLLKLNNDEVKVKILHGGVGAVNESDISLAEVFNAIIIGFNVRPSAIIYDMVNSAGVDMRLYTVIYNAIEDVKNALTGMLDPDYKEVVQGHIEIRQIYKVSSIGTIGGGHVLDGKVTRNSSVRVVRDSIVIFEGKLASLKRFKDDVKEVAQGYECGVLVERYNDIKEGDIIESYTMEEVKR